MDGSEPQTDRGTVSRWERGVERPSLYYQRLLSELDRRLEAEGVAELRRRDLLRLGGAVSGLAAMAPVLESWDRLVLALRGSDPVHDDMVADLEAQTAGFHELERQLPGRALFPKLDAHLDGLAEVLRGRMSATQRQRTIRAAGDAAVLAGWIAWDMHNRPASMRLYKTASVAAREAGDPALLACILAYRSYGIGVDGDHRTAAGMLAEAVRHAEAGGNVMAVAWLRARQAEELASLGDTAAVDTIEQAMTVFDRAGQHERPWTRFVDRARMSGYATTVYMRLRESRLAEDSIEATLDALGTGAELAKRRALILADIANLYLQQRALEPGIEFANEALTLALRAESSPALSRLGDLQPSLRRWSNEPPARQLGERLRVVCA